MRLPRMTTRRWMAAVAATAVPLAAWDSIIYAFDANRFHKGWDPCDVTGVISAVHRDEGLVSVTVGSDDGIARGEVLDLFREGSGARYIGKACVNSLDPGSAVGQIVDCGRGLTIREGDRVAHLTWVKRR